mmetsp:Transcript_4102/g.6114  ORF Transcript_4102/g.6114 Transcript_4102/m.6114 type:complete len:147 (+) Transcript_4102:148-588(+)
MHNLEASKSLSLGEKFLRALDYPFSIPNGGRQFSVACLRPCSCIGYCLIVVVVLFVIIQFLFVTSLSIQQRSPISNVDYIDTQKVLDEIFLSDAYALWPPETGVDPANAGHFDSKSFQILGANSCSNIDLICYTMSRTPGSDTFHK